VSGHSTPLNFILFDCQLISLRRNSEQHHRFSSHWYTTYHSRVLEIVMYTLVGGTMRHWDPDDHFSRSAIFRHQIPTSSMLNINSTQQLGRYCLTLTQSRRFCRHRLIVSQASDSRWLKKVSTHRSAPAGPRGSPE
jgi:hypothetical protein